MKSEVVDADHGLVRRDHEHVEVVDLREFRGLGLRRTGHTRKLAVEPEVVLKGDGGEGLVLVLDLDVLFGLDGLVESVAPAPAGHEPARELVHDHHLAVLDHIVHVEVEQGMGLQGLVHMVHQIHVRGIVQIARAEHLLDLDVALLGKRRGLGLFLDRVINVLLQARDDAVDLIILVRGIFRGTGDDKRGPGLVDQDRVDLVHDGKVELALSIVRKVEFHVIAQIVEPELVVRAVGHVRAVGLLPLFVRKAMDDHAHGHTEEGIDRAHPQGVTPGEIVVHRDHMHTLAGETVQIHRQRGYEGLAFPGLHLRDLSLVQHDTADELHVEVAHTERPFGHLAHHGKGLGKDIVERFPVFEPLFELLGLGPQGSVREAGNPLLERVDLVHQHLNALQFPFIRGAEYFFQNRSDHLISPPAVKSVDSTAYYHFCAGIQENNLTGRSHTSCDERPCPHDVHGPFFHPKNGSCSRKPASIAMKINDYQL